MGSHPYPTEFLRQKPRSAGSASRQSSGQQDGGKWYGNNNTNPNSAKAWQPLRLSFVLIPNTLTLPRPPLQYPGSHQTLRVRSTWKPWRSKSWRLFSALAVISVSRRSVCAGESGYPSVPSSRVKSCLASARSRRASGGGDTRHHALWSCRPVDLVASPCTHSPCVAEGTHS